MSSLMGEIIARAGHGRWLLLLDASGRGGTGRRRPLDAAVSGIDRRSQPPAIPALPRRAIRKSQHLDDSAKSARYSEKSLNISLLVEKPRDIEISHQPPRSVKVANR